MALVEATTLLEQFKTIVPKLNYSLHKGQCGKIGIVGGSVEYTGAPYYAAISALKVGVDIAHIFCTESASTAIKSYSPEIIVHPSLKTQYDLTLSSLDNRKAEDDIEEKITTWFKSLHALVIGPGLGRDPLVSSSVQRIIQRAKELQLPLVIDGDGLSIITSSPNLIRGYTNAILTPNVNEYTRLCQALKVDESEEGLPNLCRSLGGVSILRKGSVDMICDGGKVISCKVEGSPRRCGGQGDVLAGSVGAMLAWAHLYQNSHTNVLPEVPYNLIACYGASLLVRECSRSAFSKHFRSTTTPDIIEEIGSVFQKFIPY